MALNLGSPRRLCVSGGQGTPNLVFDDHFLHRRAGRQARAYDRTVRADGLHGLWRSSECASVLGSSVPPILVAAVWDSLQGVWWVRGLVTFEPMLMRR